MKTSLRTRLVGSFFMVIAGLMVISAVAIFTIRKINNTLEEVHQTDFQPYKSIASANNSFYQWLRLLEDFLADDGDNLDQDEQQLLTHWNRILAQLETQLEGPLTTAGRQSLTSAISQLQGINITQERLVTLVRENRMEEAQRLRFREIGPAINSVEEDIDAYLKLQERQFEESLMGADTIAQRAVAQIAVLALLVLLITITITILVYRAVTGALRNIQGAAQELSASTSEIVATTSELTSNSVETGTAVNQATSTVEETRQTARVSSEKARSVSEDAQRVSQTAGKGKKTVEETIESMRGIQHEMNSVAQSIMRLSEQSQAVGQIISSVNDLAEQTNILSVNASIEAARAGEHGKGFSVVAQEIRSLAERSKEATGRVREILTDIQKATSAAVMTTEQASKKVDTGMQHSSRANESIEVLATSISDAARASIQIAASNSQQLAGMDQMNEAMSNINQASQQNVESAKQLESAVRNLDKLGAKLKSVVEVL